MHVADCEFVQYNVKTTDVQGEIDVIGINLVDRRVFACEVAIHLITGLQYVTNNRPDNVQRLAGKFRRDIAYLRAAFPDYDHEVMFWSPVVRSQRQGSKYNQVDDVRRLVETIQTELGLTIKPVINEKFKEALDALRKKSGNTTKELNSSVMRLLQVEEHLARHLSRLTKGTAVDDKV